MVNRIVQPAPDRPIVDESGSQSEQMRLWTIKMTNQSLIIGQGSPIGVVEAVQGQSYMDETGATGNVLYIKQSDNVLGDKTLGWKLIG